MSFRESFVSLVQPSPSTTRSAAAVAQATVRDDVRAIAAYASHVCTDGIKLDAMECPEGLPEALRAEIAHAVSRVALNRYPDSAPATLVAQLREAFAIPAQADLLFGNGSDELIHLIVQATCEPGDVVLSPSPSFVYFDMAARFNHARFVGVSLATDLSLDLDAMLEAIAAHQPKVIFLAMPNNPTGGLWPEQSVRAILKAAPGLVVIDEAYQAFTDVTWMPEVLTHPNLLVLRTLSKIGLAGLRFGYLTGDPVWMKELNKVRPPYNIDAVTLAALSVVLSHKAVLDEQAARLRDARAPLALALASLPGTTVFESAGNFLLVRFAIGGDTVFQALSARKIFVRNFSGVHPLLANCLRISIGSTEENTVLLAALNDILSP